MKKAIAILAITALVITGLVVYASNQPKQAISHSTTTVEQSKPLNADTLFNLVNTEREKANLKPLTRDTRLDTSAQQKANDMAINNYFDHVNPNTGIHGYALIPDGICVYRSENIMRRDRIGDDNQDAIVSWMNSESHKRAILDSQYDIAGMGVNDNIAVQHFCDIK